MKKSIKFLAMALCLALVISLCVAMFAANTKTSAYDYKEGEWVEEGTTFKFDGKDYTVQNDANLTGKYIDVNGTNYYLISNANDMIAVGLTSGEESFIITDDIDLGVWTMEISAFISVIEGCGNTVTFGEGSTYGLFNAVAGNINNLVLDGTINAETTLLGGLAKTFMNGKIDGIVNNADITNTLEAVDGHVPKTSGIIGAADLSFGNFEIYNCVNNGDITGSTRVAGIIANLQTSPWNDTNASGVLNLNGCSNTGTITSTNWGSAGICSIVEFYGSGEVNIVNCQNSGNIIGRFSSAGIVGTWISNGRMEACVNTGNITSRNEASAGIVGRLYCGENATVTVSNCANLGDVSSETANVAGLVGLNRTPLLYIQQSFSIGTLTPGTVEGTPQSAFGVMDRESASTSALVERCFYMNAETGMDIETNERDVGMKITQAQVENGYITEQFNRANEAAGNNIRWKQEVGTDLIPMLDPETLVITTVVTTKADTKPRATATTTEKPVATTKAPLNAPETTAAEGEEEKSGCGSSLTVASVVILTTAITGSALVVSRKRR